MLKHTQTDQLLNLINKAKNTEFGQEHNFSSIDSYETFRKQVPLSAYEDMQDDIERLKSGEANILWPGRIHDFAVSAGTTGSGKHMPVAPERMNSDRDFARKIVFTYLKQHKHLTPFFGKQLSLPGSVSWETKGTHEYRIGEISGLLAIHAPLYLKPFQLADPEKLVQLSFSEKFDTLLNKAVETDIRVITAVPSWTLTLFQHALKKTGKESIAEIWPNLSILICGGVKLANYRPHLETLCDPLKPAFIETYGASEGYFGYSDQMDRDDLKLMTDQQMFFEWIPLDAPGEPEESIVPTWEVEPDRNYQLVVSGNSGLWRYQVKDVVRFTEVDPPRFEVKGRIQDMLDDFGEATYAWEAERALQQVSEQAGLGFTAFTIGARLKSEEDIPRHCWFIQWNSVPDESELQWVRQQLDTHLQEINRHYAIRRESEALGLPQLFPISQDDINNFFKIKGKRPAQAKLPKILADPNDLKLFLNEPDENEANKA